MGAELATGFDCTVCGEHHHVLPLSFSIKAPDAVTRIFKDELEQRVVLSADQCVIDQRDHYIRGRIAIPIHDYPQEPFIWGVWAELSPRDFIRTNELWRTEGRENEPPYDGWLASEIYPFHNTLNLKLRVRTMPVGRRPHFEVLDVRHQLAVEQNEGITLARVQQLAELILHAGAGQ